MSVAWVEPRRMGVTSISRGVWRDGRRKWPVSVTGSGKGAAAVSARAASARRKPPLGGPTVSHRWLIRATKRWCPASGAASASRAVSSSKA